jgi:hypothetical protein
MEQAPLVYASKATVGVGVQAGTADNPGLEMILGYKATDVALVPVAVAKFCRDQSSANCEDAIYAMQVIAGRKQDQSSNSTLQLAIRAAELDEQREANRVQALRGDQKILLATQSKVDTRDKLAAALKAMPATLPDEDAGISSQRVKLQTDLTPLQKEALPSADEIANRIKAKESEIAAASRDLESAEASVKSLNAKLTNDVSGERGDSLSVYGTFGGSGNASDSSAGMNGNKVFATGIAAQNLSEYRGATDCLGAVNKLVDALPASATAERTKLIAESSVICTKPK